MKMASFSLKSGFCVLRRPLSKVIYGSPNLVDLRVAHISGKALRTEELVRPEPWPYMEKGYRNHHSYYDKTTKRFDENTKVIFVEGMQGLGKSEFAKSLADDLDMRYFPMITTDLVYLTPNGEDLRTIDHKVPPSMRSYDEQKFLKDPKHPKALILQLHKLMLKTCQYFDALAHLFNTGQGVVMDRSPYSDFVFAEAMHRCGYISKNELIAYNKAYNNAMGIIMKPHLVIYLDAPNHNVTENMTKRGQGEEKVFTEKFLEVMEEKYKFKYLKEIEQHAEVLIYDWSEPGDVEVIVEDIERIDFNKYEEDQHHPKMKNWRFKNEWDACERRWEFTERKANLVIRAFMVPDTNCPILFVDAQDKKLYNDVVEEEFPSYRYAQGFNPDVGDSVLFKSKPKHRFIELSKQIYY